MKGKWAQGIVPRHFAWIIRDQLAVCERPGGYGESHRKVRRQEEVIWLREQGFDPVISIIQSPHNLHAYEELGLPHEHVPMKPGEDLDRYLPMLFGRIQGLTAAGRKVLLHDEELSDRLAGIMAGYLIWSGLVPETHRAVAMVEKLIERQLAARARTIANEARELATER